MAYIPGMNQNWGGTTATPANPSATTNTPTAAPVNPVTGMPYQGGGTYNVNGGVEQVGGEYNSNAGANSWLNARGLPSEGGYGGGYGTPQTSSSPNSDGLGQVVNPVGGSTGILLSKGGAIPSYDDGGDVPDPNGEGSSGAPTDPSATGQVNVNDLLNSVMDTYEYGQQKYGIDQQQAYMSSKPAGPGGDQPNTNPFPTKTPAIPFGTRTSDSGQYQSAMMSTKPAGPGGDQPNTNPFPTKTPNPPFGKASENDDSDGDTDSTQNAASGGAIQAFDEGGTPDPMETAGGALPQPGDNSMAAPTEVMSPAGGMQTAQGALPSPGAEEVQQPPQPDMNQPGQPIVPQQGQVQAPAKIISYLRGDGAAPPQEVKQAEMAVDPSGTLDPNHLHMAVIHAAAQADQDQAFSFMQAYRQKYDLMKNIATVAVDGAPGKAPHVGASTQAANAAMDHIPDGNKVTFQPGQNGVTAAVTDANGRQQQIPMTLEAYRAFLAGPYSQFDNLMNKPVQQVLNNANNQTGSIGHNVGMRAQQPGGPVIHAVGPGNGPGASGVRVGPDLAHMRNLPYEPIPPAGATSGPWGQGKPAGASEVNADSSPDAGVPQDLRPDRVVNTPNGPMIQKPDGTQVPYNPKNDDGTTYGKNPDGTTYSFTPPKPLTGEPGATITTIRGTNVSRYDKNTGRMLPDYNQQQQHEQELQRLRNEGLQPKTDAYNKRTQSTANTKAQQIKSNERIAWEKNQSADRIAARSNLTNLARSALTANGGDADATNKAVNLIARDALKLGLNPGEIVRDAQSSPEMEQSNAPAMSTQGAGNIPAPAVQRLRQNAHNPQERQQFDAIFGAGAAAKILGQ